MDDWQKAGKITAQALEYGKRLIKADVLLIEVANAVESKIIELGGKPAFPTNISLNHIAAHYVPFPKDETRFSEGDLVKLDVGAHVNGCIGDSAITVDLGNNKELVKASQEALRAAIKLATPGRKLMEIGKEIYEVINSYGFVPIVNLSGHGLAEYNLHAGITIPNFDNGDERELIEGQTIAIEPFATPGEGKITEGKPAGIYKLEKIKPIRDMNARRIIKMVQENYRTLPFAQRWIVNEFPTALFSLRNLEKEGIISQYSQLPEKTKAMVSQAEHSVRVADKPEVLTKKD